MKKITLNFQKPNFASFIATLLLVGLMTACQKENIQEMPVEQSTKTEREKNTPYTRTTKGAETVLLDLERPNATSATSRSATTLKYQAIFKVKQGEYFDLFYPKDQLPDSTIWKVEVEVRPISGDPDLFIFGYDQDELYLPFRPIRSSELAGTATEKTSYRGSDIKAAEEEAYMSVYGWTAAEFEVSVYFTTVDCIEYPVIEPIVTLELVPVCGCDGYEYPNASSAFASGITSWTEGSCNPIIDGTWVNIDVLTDDITRMIISNDAQTIRVFGSCNPTDCDWEEEALIFVENHYSAVYDHGFAISFIEVYEQDNDQLKMEILTKYEDDRPDQTEIHYFEEEIL